MPIRRGTFIVPDQSQWIVRGRPADLTSGSLRDEIRRGMPVMPAEVRWIIKRYSADPTSGSLRGDNCVCCAHRFFGTIFACYYLQESLTRVFPRRSLHFGRQPAPVWQEKTTGEKTGLPASVGLERFCRRARRGVLSPAQQIGGTCLSRPLGGACLSCPLKCDGSSKGIPRAGGARLSCPLKRDG